MLNVIAKPARILIAAEQPLEALALENMLRTPNRNGGVHELRVTSDAREIIPLHGKWAFSLLVLDMGIASQNSLEVLHLLSGPINHGRLAVLALTGAGDGAAHERALDAGVVSVLERPLERNRVVHQATQALQTVALQTAAR